MTYRAKAGARLLGMLTFDELETWSYLKNALVRAELDVEHAAEIADGDAWDSALRRYGKASLALSDFVDAMNSLTAARQDIRH